MEEDIYIMKPAPHHQLTEEEKQRIERMAMRGNRREDKADAFMRENPDGPQRVNDELAEDMAEGFLTSATSGEESNIWLKDDEDPDDILETSADKEFASGFDDTNPPDAEPADVPTVGKWQPFKKPD